MPSTSLYDLLIVQETLRPKGIIAVHDFLNTECLGVVEAVCHFLDRKPQLVPFLLTSNKLLLAPVRAAELTMISLKPSRRTTDLFGQKPGKVAYICSSVSRFMTD